MIRAMEFPIDIETGTTVRMERTVRAAMFGLA
jgi:hypothetical protein